MSKNNNSPTKSMWMRMTVILLVVIILFVSCGGRLFYLMIIRGEELSNQAEAQQLSTVSVAADRGIIYDRNGSKLASSATVWTVFIVPNKIGTTDDNTSNEEKNTDAFKKVKEEQSRLISDGLSKILEISSDEIYKKTCKNTAYEKIKSKVEAPQAAAVREFVSNNNLGRAVGLDEGTKRYYSEGSLASTILGFVGEDNQGLGGLEYQYDSLLQGIPGKVVTSVNALGGNMPFTYETMIEPEQGKSLTLTIDKKVQYTVEKYLEEAVIANDASNKGCCIVLDVNTGEIIAMATKPDFDPNDPFVITDTAKRSELEKLKNEEEYSKKYNEYLESQWRNKAIADTYEPGSVFKIITGSSAIEENKVSQNASFDCPGYIVISGTRYNCHDTAGHGHQNLTNIFENSCNPAFIEIGQRLGVDLFYKYFKAYGFTQKTGIDLPGEAEGIYYTDKNMGPVELASESFGQTFRITPIQLITAVAAACNGGYYITPHLVKEITDKDGNVIERINPEVKRQVISEDTSKLMCSMLRSVVDNGSGKNAYVAGYRMCGKTGTSQKIDAKDPDGTVSKYIASFCGFAPADRPQYAILVMIDEPNGSSYYGSAVSAPVAKQIMSEILPYLGVEARYTDEEYTDLNITVPNVLGLDIDSAQEAIENVGFTVKIVGSGTEVLKQVPSAGLQSSKNSTVVLYTEEDTETTQVSVPDFTSKSPSEVNDLAESYGLNVTLSGVTDDDSEAVSFKQSIDAGKTVDSGTVITVYFRYNDTVE